MDEQKTENPSWYKDGLSFSCTQCGNCCTGAPGYVWLTMEEVENIQGYVEENNILPGFTKYIRKVGNRYSLTEYKNGDCIFLKRWQNGKTYCAINPVKPSQCNAWPFWETILKNKQIWNDCSRNCPGMNNGRHYPWEEIEQLKEVEGKT